MHGVSLFCKRQKSIGVGASNQLSHAIFVLPNSNLAIGRRKVRTGSHFSYSPKSVFLNSIANYVQREVSTRKSHRNFASGIQHLNA